MKNRRTIQQHRAEIPSELAGIIHRGLAKDPGQRFADARVLHGALLPFVTRGLGA